MYNNYTHMCYKDCASQTSQHNLSTIDFTSQVRTLAAEISHVQRASIWTTLVIQLTEIRYKTSKQLTTSKNFTPIQNRTTRILQPCTRLFLLLSKQRVQGEPLHDLSHYDFFMDYGCKRLRTRGTTLRRSVLLRKLSH